MTSESQSAVPRSYWIISGLALVWNLMGVANYIAQVTMSEDALLQLTEAERALIVNAPAWSTGAFALAVNAGALGCILLLFRKSWATPLLILSLVSAVATFYYWLVLAGAMSVYGPGALVMPVLVIVIGVFLVWYARRARAKGWIS
jgi:hypothetical protein